MFQTVFESKQKQTKIVHEINLLHAKNEPKNTNQNRSNQRAKTIRTFYLSQDEIKKKNREHAQDYNDNFKRSVRSIICCA